MEGKCKLEIQATHLKMWQNQEMTTVTVSRNTNVYKSSSKLNIWKKFKICGKMDIFQIIVHSH